MSESELFDVGLEIRREVLGAEYVDRSLANADEFLMPMQELSTAWCWGAIWSREGLDRRSRSLINLAMLTALGKTHELQLHVRGAIANGLTVTEIRETLLHAAVYCGVPAGLQAFKAAHETLREIGAIGATD